MIALVFAMILCLVLGLAVVGIVAIPARREGREVLTPRGEDVITRVKERTESVAAATKEKTGDLVSTTRQKVADVTNRDSAGSDARSPEAS